jgi:hypothetical protein
VPAPAVGSKARCIARNKWIEVKRADEGLRIGLGVRGRVDHQFG